MKVIQILPALESGGVERGTVELNAFLVKRGHESVVISRGGRLVEDIERDGGRHLTMVVGRKHPATLLLVAKLRAVFKREKPDIIHLRSRLPAWIAWWAWKKLPVADRPALVTTVHGFNSVSRYSAIMTRGQRVIAVSRCIREFILENYPEVSADEIRVIPRGVDPAVFFRGFQPDAAWQERWRAEHPELAGKFTLLLPGRITRLKGHRDLVAVLARLKAAGVPAHGLVAGEAHPGKEAYAADIHARLSDAGLTGDVTFLGNRLDLREIMAVSDVVLSLSIAPESFGRTALEALALGVPIAGYDHGGVGEQLAALFPEGRIAPGDTAAMARLLQAWHPSPPRPTAENPFSLEAMLTGTEAVYEELVKRLR